MVAGEFPLLDVLPFFLCQDVPCRCGNQYTTCLGDTRFLLWHQPVHLTLSAVSGSPS